MAGSVTAARVSSTRQRLADLRKRLDRLRAGETPTPEDLDRARAHARAQQTATTHAYARLMRTQALAVAQTRRIAELAEPSAQPREQPTEHRLVEENARLRDALVAIQTYSPRGGPNWPEEERRWVWRALVDECRSHDWRSWAHAVCMIATRLVPDVRGAALTLYGQDHAVYPLAASDRWSQHLEEIHQIVGEGPALEVSITRCSVVVEDLGKAYARWPGFVEAAAATGLHNLLAVPVPLSAGDAGSLTLYRTARGPLSRIYRTDAALLGEVAAVALLADVDAIRHDIEAVDPAGDEGVHIAAGMLSVRLGVSVSDAMVQIRAYAYGTGRSLTEAAQAVRDGSFPHT